MSNMQTPPRRARRTPGHLKHVGFPGMWIKGLVQNTRGIWVPRLANGKPGEYPAPKARH